MATLQDLQTALHEPFEAKDIKFKVACPRKKQDANWECLALPYAEKHVYEDRLNILAYGEWSTPYTQPILAGNTMLVPVTVVICGVPHTDLAEYSLAQEEESASEAYLQAFRRACSQFGLGRYLSFLPELWLPYDPTDHTIIMSHKGERVAWAEKLYTLSGFQPRPQQALSSSVSRTKKTTAAAETRHSLQTKNQPSHVSHHPQVVDEKTRTWLAKTLTQKQMQKVLTRYNIDGLHELTQGQADNITQQLLDLEQQTRRS